MGRLSGPSPPHSLAQGPVPNFLLGTGLTRIELAFEMNRLNSVAARLIQDIA